MRRDAFRLCRLKDAPVNNERRHHLRIAFDAPAELTTDLGVLQVMVMDLSLKGALVTLPLQGTLGVGTYCGLRIVLSEGGDRIAMMARVAQIQGKYAGLKIRSIDLDSVSHLRRLIELNAGDPGLLDRELRALVAPR